MPQFGGVAFKANSVYYIDKRQRNGGGIMTKSAKRIVFAVVSIAASLPTASIGQQKVDDKLQAEVVIAVAAALGANPANVPSYEAELKTARRTADVAALCGPAPQFLTPAIAEKVVARAIELLKLKDDSLWERPRYVRDLIVVSATSFEAGRFAGMSKEYRTALVASVSTPSNCNLAGR